MDKIIENQHYMRREGKGKIPHPKKKHHIFRNLMLVLLVLVLAAGAAFAYIYSNVQKSLKQTYVNTGSNSSTIVASKPLTIILMGVDTGDTTRGGAGSWDGNSDSQIVMTLNPKTNTTTMVSMERDTMTNIEDGQGNIKSTQKMNAAYPAGYNSGGISQAVQYAMKTIGNQAGISVNNFVVVNMDGIINLVNDVGGVNVINDTKGQDVYMGTTSGNITLPVTHQSVASGAIYISNTEPSYTSYVPYIKGEPEQLVNGNQALVFARDRDTLPNGDYGRAAHQREVLSQLVKKMLNINNVLQYQKFLKDISSDFKTNISSTANNVQALMAYKNCFNKIVSIQYQGIGETAKGASYQFMPANVDLAVQNAMRQSIGEASSSSLNSDIITYENYFGRAPSANYFMPSATVTIKGQSPVVYGLDTSGNLVSINSTNAGDFVSTNGSAVGKSATTGVSDSSTQTYSTSTSQTNGTSSYSNSGSNLPSGLTATGTQGVYTSPKGYTIYYKNGYYVYKNGTLYPNGTKYPGQ